MRGLGFWEEAVAYLDREEREGNKVVEFQSIADADRNWPDGLGEVPPPAVTAEVTVPLVRRAIDEGMAPAAVADLVADAVAAGRFWVLTDPQFTEVLLRRRASPRAAIPRPRSTCRDCRRPSRSPRRSSGCWPAWAAGRSRGSRQAGVPTRKRTS